MHPTGFTVDLGDPHPLQMRVVVLGEVGDDTGHQPLVVGVEAVLGGVQRGVALDDPSQVAGTGLAQDDVLAAGRAAVGEDLADRAHRLRQAGPVGGGHGGQERAHGLVGPLGEQARGLTPARGEGDLAAPGITRGRSALDQPVVLELVQDPAQVPGVQGEFGPQIHRVGTRGVCEFVEHPGLGQRVRGVQLAAVVESADDVRVEAVEGADVLDGHECRPPNG